jgi:hypothetical protein
MLLLRQRHTLNNRSRVENLLFPAEAYIWSCVGFETDTAEEPILGVIKI